MRPRDEKRAASLESKLIEFDKVRRLPGINNSQTLATLVEQMIDSLRRIEYVKLICNDRFDAIRADPSSLAFDPIRAAILKMRNGELDEAFWLIFLSVHFGKHEKDGWVLARNVYGALGGPPWTWSRVSANVESFRVWLASHHGILKRSRFSNHRKYQSLDARSKVGTGSVVASYVKWVAPPRTHQEMIREIHVQVGQDPKEVFDHLYKSMEGVTGFGRLGRFDFLTMLGKLGLAPIEPGLAYLSGASGPLAGARLLFAGDRKAKVGARKLDALLIELDLKLNVGMQVLEDSLCNWQKSPRKFISFRG